MTKYDDDGDLYGVTKYKYNNDDNVIDASEYDEDGKLQYNQSLEYNGSLLSKVTSTLKYSKEENELVHRGMWNKISRAIKALMVNRV